MMNYAKPKYKAFFLMMNSGNVKTQITLIYKNLLLTVSNFD